MNCTITEQGSGFRPCTNHFAGENGGGALPDLHFDVCFVKCGRGGGRANLAILSRFRKCASFLGLFGRNSSHKSPNFLRSRLRCSAVPCLMVREKSDARENHELTVRLKVLPCTRKRCRPGYPRHGTRPDARAVLLDGPLPMYDDMFLRMAPRGRTRGAPWVHPG